MGEILSTGDDEKNDTSTDSSINSSNSVNFDADTDYLIYCINNKNKIALDVPLKKDNGVKVTCYPLHAGTHQKYKFHQTKDNHYLIQNQYSLKYLQLKDVLTQEERSDTNPYQLFKMHSISSTSFIITVQAYGDQFCLDSARNELKISKYNPSDIKSTQKFVIEPFKADKPEYQVAPSTYIIWHSKLQNSCKSTANNISVMYSIQPTETHSCTYWSCVFPKGYMGIQDKNPNLKWIIFSIWDVTLNDVIAKGPNTKCDLFGGEGVGVRTHIPYNWILGEIYTFQVVYENEKDADQALVSAYFLKGDAMKENEFDHKGFELIASMKVPNNKEYIFNGNNRFTNFIEDWDSGGGNGDKSRSGLFGKIKILNNGKLIECNEFHGWCAETRPFKKDNYCVKCHDDRKVCMTIGGL